MELISFGGTDINGSTGLVVRYGYGSWTPSQANISGRERVNMPFVIDTITYPSKQQPFTVSIGAVYSGTVDEFMSTVNELFSVRLTAYTLIAERTAGDASTEVQVQARVSSFGRIQNNQWQGTFEVADPVWQSTSPTTDTSSPTINTGELFAIPTVTISGSTNATRNRLTVTDNTGQGFANYPIKVGYTSSRDAAHIRVWLNGRSIPFRYNSTSGALWVRVDCGPSGKAFVDIYYSTAINNTVTANALDMGGLSVAGTNAIPAWSDWGIEAHPDAMSLIWVPGLLPKEVSPTYQPDTAWTYGIVNQASGSLTFQVSNTPERLAQDASMAALILPVPASGTFTATFTWTNVNAIDPLISSFSPPSGFTLSG